MEQKLKTITLYFRFTWQLALSRDSRLTYRDKTKNFSLSEYHNFSSNYIECDANCSRKVCVKAQQNLFYFCQVEFSYKLYVSDSHRAQYCYCFNHVMCFILCPVSELSKASKASKMFSIFNWKSENF